MTMTRQDGLKLLDEVIRAFEAMQYQSSYETKLHNKLIDARKALK